MSDLAAQEARVAAVVVVWQDLGPTLDAIASLLASSVAPDPLICIAQQLGAEDLMTLRAALDGHLLVVLEENIGFASAANLGIAKAMERGCRWVFLANNDATFSPVCIARCLEEAVRAPRTAVVSPAVAYSDRPNRLWFAGASQSRSLAVVWHRGYFSSAAQPPPSRGCDYIPSCAALMSIQAWQNVGPMRDDYFMYFEDVEWGARARAAGWRLQYLGEVLAWHVMGGSSDHQGSRLLGENTAYYLARNPVRFALETRGTLLRASRLFGTVVIWTIFNISRIRPRDWTSSGRAMLEGLEDGFAARMGRRDLARRTNGKRRERGRSAK